MGSRDTRRRGGGGDRHLVASRAGPYAAVRTRPARVPAQRRRRRDPRRQPSCSSSSTTRSISVAARTSTGCSTRAIPGELIEHATLTEAALDRAHDRHRRAVHRRRRALRLPVPAGERLGSAAARIAKAVDYTPRLRRVHDGDGRRAGRLRVLQLSLQGWARRRRHADAERVPAGRRRAHRRRRSAQSAAPARSGSGRTARAAR